MLCGSLDGRVVWGRMGTCIWMAESLHCSPEIITLELSPSVESCGCGLGPSPPLNLFLPQALKLEAENCLLWVKGGWLIYFWEAWVMFLKLPIF